MTYFILHFETEQESSIIEKVEWSESNNEMEVTFHNGNVYEYQNISKEIINKAMNAPSLGSYLKTEIFSDPVKYPFEKIG